MDAYKIVLLILIIIFALQCLRDGYEHFQNSERQSMIPFETPFHSDFFRLKIKKMQAGKSATNTYETRIFALFTPQENCGTTAPQTQLIHKLNNHKLDYAVILESLVHDAIFGIGKYRGKKMLNLRFVANLFPGDVTMIASDESGIDDITDIVKLRRKAVINVGTRNSATHLSCKTLILEMGMKQLVKFDYTTNQEQLNKKYVNTDVDVIYRIGPSPIDVIKSCSRVVVSHLVSLKPLNNGNIFKIADSEKEFYDGQIAYKKSLHDIDRLIPKVYPNLTTNDRNRLYIETVSTNYMLITHDQAPNSKILPLYTQIVDYTKMPLKKRKNWLKHLTKTNLSYTKLPITTHPAAKNNDPHN